LEGSEKEGTTDGWLHQNFASPIMHVATRLYTFYTPHGFWHVVTISLLIWSHNFASSLGFMVSTTGSDMVFARQVFDSLMLRDLFH
jgi:hypothetical protein